MDFFINNIGILTYLFLKLDSINGLFTAALFISTLTFLGATFIKLVSHDTNDTETFNASLKYVKYSVIVLLISGFLTLVTPSQKQLAIMLGVMGVTHVATQSETAAKAGKLLQSYIDAELDKQLEELKNKKK